MNTKLKNRVPRAKAKRIPNRRKKITVKTVIFRMLMALIAVLLFAVFSLYALCFTIAHGPSETVRNQLVLSALQASATKWVPSLVLPKSTVDKIWEDSFLVKTDEIDIEDYTKPDESKPAEEDEWANAKDGMLLFTENGSTYKAYILLVKDPSRVFVGPTYVYDTATKGARIFEACKQENAVAAINGGEYLDTGGSGSGAQPMGITYSKGSLVWGSALKRTFIGFDQNDKLVVKENMTEAIAKEMGIRDGVSFQQGNILIESDGNTVKLHYVDENNGMAQRTAIGQRADGTVILIVTDGRTASSLGATRNDIIDVMVSCGAVSAGMLDGGSSTLMYYEDYYKKYGIDENTLDEYQKQGLTNKYKAFTTPRYMPTYFLVKAEDN